MTKLEELSELELTRAVLRMAESDVSEKLKEIEEKILFLTAPHWMNVELYKKSFL